MSNDASTILNHSLKLLIPDRDSNGQPLDATDAVNGLTSQMLQSFGGLQRNQFEGWYTNRAGALVCENVTALKSLFGEGKLIELVAVVMAFTAHMFNGLNQEAAAAEVDGKLIIIERGGSLPPAGAKSRLGP